MLAVRLRDALMDANSSEVTKGAKGMGRTVGGEIVYEPGAGEHIDRAAEKALAIAERRQLPVVFTFNDVVVNVQPGEPASAIVLRWTREMDRQAEAYRNSPEGRRAAAEAVDAQRKAQRATTALVERMDLALEDLDSAVAWCAELARVSDHVGIEWDKGAVADALERAGFVRDMHVGRPPADFERDRILMGEYLIGQTIDCLRQGMPPHSMVIHFAEQGGFIRPVERSEG